MANITAAKREEIIRTLIECRARVSQARTTHLGLDGHMNLEPARLVIEKALQVFEGLEYPQEVTLAAQRLQAVRGALQQFNSGVAVDVICAAAKQIEQLEQRLAP